MVGAASAGDAESGKENLDRRIGRRAAFPKDAPQRKRSFGIAAPRRRC
jgi:hypothetical protein